MKIDRLLSIIVYLLNHDLVSARSLAERYSVSVRTIQRDLETIDLAGIPVYSIQGAGGGYGIMESYKMDRQLLTTEDFYFILTALQSVNSTLEDETLDSTLEKIKTLTPVQAGDFFSERNQKLSIDFTMLGGDPRGRAVFQTIKQGVDSEHLVQFTYTSNQLQATERTVEPMTIAFRWRGWYLFGFCHLRQEYRIFRLSRIKNPRVLNQKFKPRGKTFESFITETPVKWSGTGRMIDLRLSFSPEMSPLVEEFFSEPNRFLQPDGRLEVTTCMPDDGSLYAYILSFGHFVRVMEPEELKHRVRNAAMKIADLY